MNKQRLEAGRLQVCGGRSLRSHLQDLDVGLMRIRHLHAVDLDEVERRDLVHVGGVLQAAHHLVDRGGLPCARHA